MAQNRPLSSPRPVTAVDERLSVGLHEISHEGTAKGRDKAQLDQLEEDEERETGAVSWKAYGGYIRAMGNPCWAIIILASLILGQVANVGNSLMLGFWSGQSIAGWGPGQYMSVYAGFGIAMAISIVSALRYFVSFAPRLGSNDTRYTHSVSSSPCTA